MKTSKTETFTTRLHPRAKFALELMSRARGKSLAKTIEQVLNEAFERDSKTGRFGDLSAVWSPDHLEATMNLAKAAPELLAFDEACLMTVINNSPAIAGDFSRAIQRRASIYEQAQVLADTGGFEPITE